MSRNGDGILLGKRPRFFFRSLMTFALLAVVVTSACNFREEKGLNPATGTGDNSGNGNAEGQADFALVQSQLLTPQCVSCHNAGRASAGVDLSSFSVLMSGRTPSGKALVSSGSAAESSIVTVIESGRMPPGGSKPTEMVMNLLRCWIDQGAAESGQAAACAEYRLTSSGGPQPRPTLQPTQRPTPKPTSTPSPTPGNDDGGNDDGDDDGGTDDGGDTGGTPALSFTELFDRVLQPSCVGCHNSNYAAADVDLSTFEKTMASQPGVLVLPGDAQNSNLVSVVKSGYMPMGNPLSAELVQLVERWVSEGAKP